MTVDSDEAFSPRSLAEKMVNLGFAVLPLHANKVPVSHLVPRGFLDASKLKGDLWRFEHEDVAMVGYVPGSKGLVALDVDVKHGDGVEELVDISYQAYAHGKLASHHPTAWDIVVKTPSGGYHILLQKPNPEEFIGNQNFSPNINTRSDAGYLCAPGNPGYELIKGTWDPYVYQEAPEWVMDRLRSAAPEALDEPYDIPEARLEEEWHHKVGDAYRLFNSRGDRHSSMAEAVMTLASHELLGYAGSTDALKELEGSFIRAVADRSSEHEARIEYRRALTGARERVRKNKSTVLEGREQDDEFLELIKANGGTEEDAERIAEIAARSDDHLPFHGIRELCEKEFKLDWLVRNVLVSPTYGQIAGESKSLKTYISQYLGIAIATGYRFLGTFPVDKAGPVVFFVGEGGMKGWSTRMPRIAESVGVSTAQLKDAPIYASFTPAPFLSPLFKNSVEYILETYNPALTIIDPLYAYAGGEIEAQNMLAMGALLTDVAKPFVEHGSTVLINNHFNKQTGKVNLNRITMSGSGEWVDSWILNSKREEPDLNSGQFYITTEFGSRQWGGSRWDIDLNIGRMSPMGSEPQTPIHLEIRESWGD